MRPILCVSDLQLKLLTEYDVFMLRSCPMSIPNIHVPDTPNTLFWERILTEQATIVGTLP